NVHLVRIGSILFSLPFRYQMWIGARIEHELSRRVEDTSDDDFSFPLFYRNSDWILFRHLLSPLRVWRIV
ncbi:MAG: hypothetical protein ACXW06_06990, partial [Halobacteriota archaeon]